MHCYIVIYDLCSPNFRYDRFYSILRNYNRWGRLTESAWAIVSSKTYVQIRDELKDAIDTNDRLFVIKSGQQAAWTSVIASNDWLKSNIIL